MIFAAMWSLAAVIATGAFGLIVIYLLRKRKRAALRNDWSANEKSAYTDNETAKQSVVPTKLGSPLPVAVTASNPESIDRAQWVLRMSRYMFNERHQSKYNVVVINKELEYHFDAEGIVERHHVNYHEPPKSRTVPYDIVVFREGILYNMGDGGDINWDWMGNFVRNGSGMLTFKPCEIGRQYVQDPWVASLD